MKNQGVWITRILSLALCAFVILYMGHYILSLWDEPVRTTTAVLFTTSRAQTVSGFIVRDEDVLALPSLLTQIRVGESERVSKGQTLAVSYQTAAAMEESRTLADCLERRELLAYMEYHSSGISESVSLDDQIRARMSSMLTSLGGEPSGRITQDCLDLKTLLFRQNYAFKGDSALTPLIAALDADIERLSGSVAAASTTLRADSPGLFSAHTDGLEGVWTADALKNLTVAGYNMLASHAPQTPVPDRARLVRGWTWQFACLMPSASAQALGAAAEVSFDGMQPRTLDKISVSPADGEMCAVVFQSSRYISSVLTLRKVQAEIVFAEYQGVRVPREGLRIDETGQRYVYCLLLGQIVRKNVSVYDEIDRENYYLAVYEPSGANALLPGDEIVVSGRDLYDGKVLRK